MIETIELYPGGYPVHIDVPQYSIHGIGTAMRFELPLHGANFPLSHQHEKKLIATLAGELAIKAGGKLIAHLNPGQGLLLPAGTAHRISQTGATPSMVGIALWPGAVEEAFRSVAQHVATHNFYRPKVVELLARYGVNWQEGLEGAELFEGAAAPLDELLQQLPAELASSLTERWKAWLPRSA